MLSHYLHSTIRLHGAHRYNIIFSTCEIWPSIILGCDVESLDDKFHAFFESSQHLLRVLDPEDEGNGQLMLHTDSHASDSGTVRREGRTIPGAKSKQLYSETALSRKPFGIGNMYLQSFSLRMANTMISQNIDLSSWDTLYIRNHSPTNTASHPKRPEFFFSIIPYHSEYNSTYSTQSGQGSSVGIATDYRLDGPGSNPGGDEIFRPSRSALGPPSLL